MNDISRGKASNIPVTLMLIKMPNRIPTIQKPCRRNHLSRAAIKNNRKEIMGMSVAEKWMWAKKRGIVRTRTIKKALRKKESPPHHLRNMIRERLKMIILKMRFCL